MIRVMIVEDSAFMRNLIKSIFNDCSDIEIIAEAKNGVKALEKLKECNPDCITMDINMPEMDGIECTKRIMTTNPIPIVLVTAFSEQDISYTVKALEYGAVDFIQKPGGKLSTDLSDIKDKMIEKIRLASKLKLKRIRGYKLKDRVVSQKNKVSIGTTAKFIVGIGSSTGGPGVLREIIPRLTAPNRVGVLISQHMPAKYTEKLAEQLNKITKLQVQEAEDNSLILENTIYICPGNYNMIIRNKKIRLENFTDEDIYTPSVSKMLRSIGEAYKGSCIGVILTGLGDDGSKGIQSIKENKGILMAQDENTCAVFGMPSAAIKTGLIDFVGTPEMIAMEINKKISRIF